MKKQWIIIVVGLFLLATCAKDVYSPDACFKEDVLPIFISNCTFSGCHNTTDQAAGYDLSNYDGIMTGVNPKNPLLSKVYTTVKGNNPSMPKDYPKLSTKDVNTIKIWIKMGAPNSSNCKSCDTINFTFSKRIQPVMQTWCTGCHNSGNSSGGINLSNYNGVVGAIAGNKLQGSIKHLPGFSPMPKNAGKIQDCDIISIEKWMKGGNPDN